METTPYRFVLSGSWKMERLSCQCTVTVLLGAACLGILNYWVSHYMYGDDDGEDVNNRLSPRSRRRRAMSRAKRQAERLGCRSPSFLELVQSTSNGTSNEGGQQEETTRNEETPLLSVPPRNEIPEEPNPDETADEQYDEDDDEVENCCLSCYITMIVLRIFGIFAYASWRVALWSAWHWYCYFIWSGRKVNLLILWGLCVISHIYRSERMFSMQRHKPTPLQYYVQALCWIVFLWAGWNILYRSTSFWWVPPFTWQGFLVMGTVMVLFKAALESLGRFLFDWSGNDTISPFDKWLAERGSEPTQEECHDHLRHLSDNGRSFQPSNTPPSHISMSMPLDEKSLVVWDRGIRVEWLDQVFFKLPIVDKLIQHGCTLWYFRDFVLQGFLIEQGFSGQSMIEWAATKETAPSTSGDGAMVNATAVRPNAFISYTGAYKMKTLRDAIHDFPPGTIIWLDLFNVNQFVWRSDAPAAKVQKDVFHESVIQVISSIRSRHLLVEGWAESHDATRKIWVVWELFLTLKANAHFEIISSKTARRQFKHDTIIAGKQALKAIVQIDVLKADASKKQDRIRILENIKEYGADQVNQVVKRGLFEWHVMMLRDAIEDGTLDEPEQLIADRLVAESLVFQDKTPEAVRTLLVLLKHNILATSDPKTGSKHRERRQSCLLPLKMLVQALVELRDFKAASAFAKRLVVECELCDIDALSLETVTANATLGGVLLLARRYAEARSRFEWCVENMPVDHSEEKISLAFRLRYSLAQIELVEDNALVARSVFQQLHADACARLGEDNPITIAVLRSWITAQLVTGVGRAAAPHAEQLYACRCESLGMDHALTKDAFRLWQSIAQGNFNDNEFLNPFLDEVPLKTQLEQAARVWMMSSVDASERGD